jgi:hypothetical protein
MDIPKFAIDEKVILKNQLIYVNIIDFFPCSQPYYYVQIDGEIKKKKENELSYCLLKQLKIQLIKLLGYFKSHKIHVSLQIQKV